MRSTFAPLLLAGAALVAAFGFAAPAAHAQANPPANAPAAAPAGADGDPYSAPPLPACDPMDWKQPEPVPPLRERMTPEGFDKVFQRAKVLAPRYTVEEAAARPLFALAVVKVEPGSQAEQLGIKPNQSLWKLDDHELSTNEDLVSFRTRADQKLTLLTFDGQVKTLTLKRGKIGVETAPHWDVYASYLRSPGREAKYDDYFRAVSILRSADRAFAEACMWHAWKDGYRGYPLSAEMTMDAYAECRFDAALGFAMIALKDAKGQERDMLGRKAYGAALGTFKLELARDLLKQFPAADPDPAMERLEDAIRTYRAFPKQVLPNPIEQLKTLRFRDATADISAISVGAPDKDWMDAAARDLAARKPLHLEAPSSRMRFLPFVPPAADVDLKMQFSYAIADQEESDYAKAVSVMIQEGGPDGRPVVKVTFYPTGRIVMLRDGAPDFVAWMPTAVGVRKPAHLHLAAVGHRLEGRGRGSGAEEGQRKGRGRGSGQRKGVGSPSWQ